MFLPDIREIFRHEGSRVRSLRRAIAVAICVGIMGLAMLLANVAEAGKDRPRDETAAQHQAQPATACSFAVVTTISTGIGNEFSSVVALAANNVWAVGDYQSEVSQIMPKTLIEHWNGATWSAVTSPSPGDLDDTLAGIAAHTAGDMWVVGNYKQSGINYDQTLVEHWDGTTWSIVPSPNPSSLDNYLTGVTAIAANDVWAVGYFVGAGNVDNTLIEHWDGNTWSLVASPNPGAGGDLLDVSALATGSVWAVGYYFDVTSGAKTLVEHWDGTTWSVVASPNQGANSNSLSSLSALSANDVWAAGNYFDVNAMARTLIEHWDGTEWSIIPSPNQGSANNILRSVGALAANDVWVSGTYDDANSTVRAKTLLERWNGTQWSIVPSPNPGMDANYLSGISGVAAGDIWAVGDYDHPLGGQLTLAEHWDGTRWSAVLSPNPGTVDNELDGVSAVAADDVWAVGYGTVPLSDTERTLIEHWNGSAWSIIDSPNQDSGTNQLSDVDAISANNIWAVGTYYSDTLGYFQTLTEHWDGTTWSVVPSADSGSNFNELLAVSARTSNDVWAVGNHHTGPGSQAALVEHWNGSAWTVVPSVDPGGSAFNDVAAVGQDDVWAVGYYGNANTSLTLVEHWDGAIWSIVSSPNPSSLSLLEGVTAVSSNDVWAVGYYLVGGNTSPTLVEHWDGMAWSIVSSPNVGPFLSWLYKVAAAGPNDVWAVGISASNNVAQTLAEHWDGTRWSVVPSANIGAGSTYLTDVSPVGANDIWAVGKFQYSSGSQLQTLAEHYTCTPPTPSPSPSPSASPTPNACTLQFEDVPSGSTFYPFVRCMACQGIISGYPCGTTGEPCNPTHDPYFRPNANVTRGQIAKIVALSSANHSPVSGQHFHDVPPGSTFYTFTEQLASSGVMSGYPCGGVGEPCGPGNLPYFRPNSSATRGQLSKIDANAAGYHDTPSGRQFQDVAPASAFYTYTYELASRSIMAGYPCGGAGEPCGPGSLPYFRPNNQVTRGQTSKIVGNTFFPDCSFSPRNSLP